jgi:hypothetical protein
MTNTLSFELNKTAQWRVSRSVIQRILEIKPLERFMAFRNLDEIPKSAGL